MLYRLQEADTVIEHLIQMRGIVSVQNYWSMRAEIHACGETGRIPADMHQSFIDQWNHMEGMLNGYPVGIYIDIEPEIAYQNIQNSDDYTEGQKAFYSLDYSAFKDLGPTTSIWSLFRFLIKHFQKISLQKPQK